MHFLLNNNQEKFIFSSLLLGLYSLVKLFNIYRDLLQLRRSVGEVFQTLPFPAASSNDLGDNTCPMCQSEYQDPIVLTCKVSLASPVNRLSHVFVRRTSSARNESVHGSIATPRVPCVDVNYPFVKRIIAMDSLRDI